MADTRLTGLLKHLHPASGPAVAPPTDREALAAFIARRDEAAFAELVRRHGPMVLRVCRRVLRHAQDAEDACQATFLVLARKAAAVGRAEALASWLHGVAVRTALRARRDAGRRRAREQQAPAGTGPDPAEALAWRDVQTLLETEIRRLPERYRAPFVLCHLEGRSRAEAAADLGLSENTVSSRLARARDRLQRRLARRGVHLSAVLAAAALAADTGASALQADFLTTTVRAATQFAARQPVTGVTGHALQLSHGAMTTMAVARMKWAAGVCAVGGLLAVGTWGAGQGPGGPPRPGGETPAAGVHPPIEVPSAGGHEATFAERQKSLKNLKLIAQALVNYHDTHGRFPEDLTDKAGKPILSWRVELLPFLESDNLYKQFNREESWDSPTNLKLLARMPDVYRVAIDPKDATHTYYQRIAMTSVPWPIVVGGEGAAGAPPDLPMGTGPAGPQPAVGPGGPPAAPPGLGGPPMGGGPPAPGVGPPPGLGGAPPFGGPPMGGSAAGGPPPGPMGGVGGMPMAPSSSIPRFPLRMAEITDGTSNTVGVVEAGPPVPWSKPADLAYDAKKPLPPMTGPYSNVRHVAMMDGTATALRPKLDETTWRRLIEPNDGNVLPDSKTMHARFAADSEEEKKALDKLREDHQALLTALEEQYREQILLQSIKSRLVKDMETASEQAEELKRLIDVLKVRNRKVRDELGVRRDGPVPMPERKP